MTSYLLWWMLSSIGLVVLAGVVGKLANGSVLGILIDSRKRYSLTHFQTVLWTIVVLSSLIAVFIASRFNPQSLQVPPTLLGLIGVSAGSAVFATAVKATKDPPSTARVSRDGHVLLANGKKEPTPARFSQIWLEEEGDFADKVISITKYQNFIFTLIILGAYVSLSLKTSGLPDLPANVVYLIGISHAGYVGGKVPNKA
jgi:hypothetical protein